MRSVAATAYIAEINTYWKQIHDTFGITEDDVMNPRGDIFPEDKPWYNPTVSIGGQIKNVAAWVQRDELVAFWMLQHWFGYKPVHTILLLDNLTLKFYVP